MVTKAIVEEIVDKYRIKVRIPILDRTSSSSIHTSTENLNTATICTLTHCDPNMRPGDIVFVAVDDRDEVVILGWLYREKQTESFCDLSLSELKVNRSVELPSETTIGQISSSELSTLKGVNTNIQEQIDLLKSQVTNLYNTTSVTDERVERLISQISTASKDIVTLQSSVATKAEKAELTELATEVNTVNTGLNTLQSSVSNKADKSEFTTLNSKVTTLNSDLTTIQSDIDTLQSNLTKMQSSLNTVQSSLNTVQSNLTTLQSSISTKAEKSDLTNLASKTYVQQKITEAQLSSGTSSGSGTETDTGTSSGTGSGNTSTSSTPPASSVLTYTKGVSTSLSTNFESTEFDCKCDESNCTITLIDQKLVWYLQKIRDHFNSPVYINSAYRCPTHNADVGGVTNSKHTQGLAADIRINDVEPLTIAQYAEDLGILGIGWYSTFVHVDTRTTKSFWKDSSQTYMSTFK